MMSMCRYHHHQIPLPLDPAWLISNLAPPVDSTQAASLVIHFFDGRKVLIESLTRLVLYVYVVHVRTTSAGAGAGA